jgi:hypothetical protein
MATLQNVFIFGKPGIRDARSEALLSGKWLYIASFSDICYLVLVSLLPDADAAREAL